jgi:hypothetical protein
MPAGRVSMRRVREVLRLGSAGVSKHEIARRMGLAPSTADSDDFGRAFRADVGHLFRLKSAGRSD